MGEDGRGVEEREGSVQPLHLLQNLLFVFNIRQRFRLLGIRGWIEAHLVREEEIRREYIVREYIVRDYIVREEVAREEKRSGYKRRDYKRREDVII